MSHSEDSAVGYYRVWQPAKYLEKIGWKVIQTDRKAKLIPIEGKNSWSSMTKGADLFVLQRPEQAESVALGLALRDHFNIPYVLEIDDNIYDVASNSVAFKFWNPNTLEGQSRIEIAEMMMQDADALTVTTEGLKEAYSKLNKNIYVLPNYQDLDFWKAKTKPSEHLTIGWAGSATHYDDLKMIWRPIKKFLRNNKNARFKVVGVNADFLKDHPQVEIDMNWVYIDNYPEALASYGFDIGLIPIVNRDFNLGKSNIKWQEYSMLEIPTIASNLGEYKAIEHGVTGFLANDDTMWLHYLEKLADSPELRKTIGEQSKQKIINDYNIEKRIHDRDNTYRTIIDNFKS